MRICLSLNTEPIIETIINSTIKTTPIMKNTINTTSGGHA